MCRRQGLGKALEETELFNTQACFLQGKKPKPRSPGRLGAFTNNLVSFCYSIWSHPSQILPNPGHYLGPYLEFCLSVPRTHPYERGHKYFSISINRTRPYLYSKPFLRRPLSRVLSANKILCYCKGHGCFATLQESFNVAVPEALLR